MKTYNVTTRVSKQANEAAQKIVDIHEKYKSSYFWSSRGNASCRRSNERRFAASVPDVQFKTAAGLVTFKMDYSESCRNCYYSADFYLDGQKKDIRLIKKITK